MTASSSWQLYFFVGLIPSILLDPFLSFFLHFFNLLLSKFFEVIWINRFIHFDFEGNVLGDIWCSHRLRLFHSQKDSSLVFFNVIIILLWLFFLFRSILTNLLFWFFFFFKLRSIVAQVAIQVWFCFCFGEIVVRYSLIGLFLSFEGRLGDFYWLLKVVWKVFVSVLCYSTDRLFEFLILILVKLCFCLLIRIYLRLKANLFLQVIFSVLLRTESNFFWSERLGYVFVYFLIKIAGIMMDWLP